ncbi:MAG: hypothetical protein ACR2PP_02180, partial [Psychrobacter sp.]
LRMIVMTLKISIRKTALVAALITGSMTLTANAAPEVVIKQNSTANQTVVKKSNTANSALVEQTSNVKTKNSKSKTTIAAPNGIKSNGVSLFDSVPFPKNDIDSKKQPRP